jgi:H+/Cl- antiporter ClcA
MAIRTSPSRLARLSILAGGIGLAAGGAAYVLVHLIALLTNLTLFQRWGWDLPSFRELDPSPKLYLAAVTGAFLVALLARWAPVIKGHGIPEAMEAILTKQSRISPRTAVAKPISAALAIGTGGPFGAEGPIIVTGGALGSLIGQVMHTSANERKILLASGAAAGMAATFGSPLAAVVLAIELLLFEFSTRAFVPLVVATSVAAGVHSALFGSGPLFTVPTHDFAGLGELPLFVPLGLLCGLLAVFVSKGLFVVEHLYRRLPVDEFWHPVIGAFAFVTVGMFQPRALGVGYDAIDDALAGRLAVATLIGLGLAKLIAWWLALGSGTSGGTLAPLLLISACFGGAVGEGVARWIPGVHVSPGAFALVAMAATFGAATRAPFASIVFVFELTRDYDAILPLMLATVIAHLLATALIQDSIMTEKLTRRNVPVPSDFHVDALRAATVGTVMTTDVQTLAADLTVAEAIPAFRRGGHGAYPVVDDQQRCLGIISRGDLLRGDLKDDEILGDVANHDLVTVSATDVVATALERMLEEGVEHLPILDAERRLVGICTRTDILSARRRHFAADRRQPGWLDVGQWRRQPTTPRT